MIHKMWYLQLLQITCSVTAAEWVSDWSWYLLAVDLKTIHIVSSFVCRGENPTLVSKESGQVNAKKSVVQYKQFNCVINNQ